MPQKTILKYLELFYLVGLLLRFLISGRIYYWSNYLFLGWFSLSYFLALFLNKSSFPLPSLLKIALGLFFGGLILSLAFGIHPLLSARELVIFLGYLFIFLSGLEILSEQNLENLILLVISSAILSALFGFRQYFTGLEDLAEILPTPELRQMEQVSLKRIFGLTFSPDFFSCFLGASLVLLAGFYQKMSKEGLKRKILNHLLVLVLSLLLFLPMLLAKSIGGFLSFLLGILALLILNFSRSFLRPKTIILFLSLAFFASAIFVWFILHRQAFIFKSQSNPVLLRLYNFQAGFKVFQERPIFGVGLGNFWIAYPKYRQPWANEVRYAHNDFIQILAEAGPIAELGLLILIFYLIWTFIKNLSKSPSILSGLLSAMTVISSHWLWDFGLYVPELSSLFFVLLAGIAVKLSLGQRQKVSKSALALLGALIFLLWTGETWLFLEQRMVKKAERALGQEELNQASTFAQKALKLIPADDYAYTLLARIASQKGEKRERIIDYYQKAIQLNPRFAFGYRNLGDYYFQSGELNLAEAEYLQALKLYPNNSEFLLKLARVSRLKENLKSAEDYTKRALSLPGNRRDALWEMAKVRSAKGETEELIKVLKELSENYQDPFAKTLWEKYLGENTR